MNTLASSSVFVGWAALIGWCLLPSVVTSYGEGRSFNSALGWLIIYTGTAPLALWSVGMLVAARALRARAHWAPALSVTLAWLGIGGGGLFLFAAIADMTQARNPDQPSPRVFMLVLGSVIIAHGIWGIVAAKRRR